MKLVTGPILGQVGTDNIRILLEFDHEGTVELEVYPLNENLKNKWNKQGRLINSSVLIKDAFRPFVFKVSGLDDDLDYGYKIVWENEVIAQSCFRIPNRYDPLKVLVVSCNALHMLKEGELDLWDSMLRDYGGSLESPPRIDMLIHIGDQIYEYARDVWKRCYQYMLTVQEGSGVTTGEKIMGIDKNLGYAGEWTAEPGTYTLDDVKEVMTELFRSIYRQNWNHPPTKVLLSRISNQMVIDDHDIRNGWGILEQDHDPESVEYAIGQSAHKAYEEYQVQLWRDIDSNYHVDHRVLRRNNSSIFLMDVRNPRTFCYNDKAPYVGFEQMDCLIETLEDSTLENLMVICSIPIILSSETATEAAAKVDVTYDVRDQWCQGSSKPEHCTLLSILGAWKKKNDKRKLLLVGGDIHMGLDSTVFDGADFLCQQIITSPITNEPTVGITGWLQDTFVRNSFVLYNRFKVQHGTRLHKRNYARIDLNKDWSFVLHDK